MSETPAYKIELDFKNPPNVESDVPKTQQIRNSDNKDTPNMTETETELTELSPPILTVTKNESTFTRGDIKFQNVTVTEDVSMKNGDYSIKRTSSQIAVSSSRQDSNEEMSTPRNSQASVSYDSENTDSGKSEKEGKFERKSKIPMLRLRQAIQKVQEEQREKKTRDRLKKPRRSSIPRLKDSKTPIKVETQLQPEDEFEKIYEEIVENKHTVIDNNELAIKIDDPEKIESKFEEIIHSYDENKVPSPSLHKEVTRLSRIPALRRKEEGTKLGGLTERVKAKNLDNNLKDGGFKVTDIKIKRFSRGNSRDAPTELTEPAKTPTAIDKNVEKHIKIAPAKPKRNKVGTNAPKTDEKIDITEKYEEINNGNTKFTKKTIITEQVKHNVPGKTKVSRNISTEASKDSIITEVIEKTETIPNRIITNETVLEENGIPTKKETVILDVSGEKKTLQFISNSNKDIADLIKDIKNDVTETVNIEEYVDEKGRNVTKKMTVQEHVILEPPVIIENTRLTKDLWLENITEDSNADPNSPKMVETQEIYAKNETKEPKRNNEIPKPQKRENIKIVKPIFTKTSNSYVIGTIKSAEVSKTFEWKKGSNIKSTTYTRSYSETPNRDTPKTDKDKTKLHTKNENLEQFSTNKPNTDNIETIISKEEQTLNKTQISEETISKNPINNKTSSAIEKLPEHKAKDHKYSKLINAQEKNDITQTDEVNPNKITDIDVKEIIIEQGSLSNPNNGSEKQDGEHVKDNEKKSSRDSLKHDLELPKKRSVLSKIAIFEGLDTPKQHVEKKLPKLKITKEQEEPQKANIPNEYANQETVEFDFIHYINPDDSVYDTVYNDQINYTPHNTPIIVKEIWKTGENLSAINPIMIEQHLDSKIQENLKKTEKVPIMDENPEAENVDILDIQSKDLDPKTKYDEVKYRKPGKPSIGKISHPDRYSLELPTIIPPKVDINVEIKPDIPKELPIPIDFDNNPPNEGDIYEKMSNKDTKSNIKKKSALLPGKIDFEFLDNKCEHKAEATNIYPANVDFITEEIQSLSESTDSTDKKINTPKRPGKIDFSAWQNKLEANKIRVGLLDKKKESNHKVFNNNVDNSSEKIVEITPIFQNIRDLRQNPDENFMNTTYDADPELKSPKISKDTYDNQHKHRNNRNESKIHDSFNSNTLIQTVRNDGNVLDNTNLPEKINTVNLQDNITESDENLSQTEAISLLPQNIEHEIKYIETPEVKLTENKECDTIETKKKCPGKIDFNAWQNKIESNKTKVVKTEFKIKKLPPKDEAKESVIINNNLAYERNISAEFGKASNTELNNNLVEAINNNKININNDEIQDGGKISNKKTLYDEHHQNIPETDNKIQENNDIHPNILNRDIKTIEIEENIFEIPKEYTNIAETIEYNRTQDEYDLTTNNNTQNNEFYCNKHKDYKESRNKSKINDNNPYTENKYLNPKFDSTNHNNTDFHTLTSNSNIDLTEFTLGGTPKSQSSELDLVDIPRSQSLAELDLGDAVKGKVQRMLVRIKSVEMEKQIDKRRISLKEMPKKMSVLEKIALFEGRAVSIQNDTNPSKTQTPSKLSEGMPEEVYLQRIEELTSARVKFGKFEDMLYWKLGNEEEIPVIALGTALMDKRLTTYIIGAAIDMGYRAFDCAYIYGNEKEVGQAFRAKIDDGTVRREDLYIMSKLWSTFHRTDLVEKACRESLENMGLEYFDLYMIHNPMSLKEGQDPFPRISTVLQYSNYSYMDAWFGMETLLTKGLVKSLGVSNFNSEQIKKILDKGRIKPVVNQVECHPYLTQQRLNDFCTQNNITLSCYGTLGSKGTPEEYKSGVSPVIDDPLVQVMASGLGVTPAQLLIRYQIENGHNVVVKSSTARHLWENLQALTFTLEPPQIDALSALNRNKRMFTFKGMGDTHKNYPFKAPF